MPFAPDQFATQLLTEALFYDAEYGALGNVSLIDQAQMKERFLASFDPESNVFLIEQAIEWEDIDADEDGEIDYALAVDGKEYASYARPDEAGAALLALAREHDLAPSFMILFEDDEA